MASKKTGSKNAPKKAPKKDPKKGSKKDQTSGGQGGGGGNGRPPASRNADSPTWEIRAFTTDLPGRLKVGTSTTAGALQAFVGDAGSLRVTFTLLPQSADPGRALQLSVVEAFMLTMAAFLASETDAVRLIATCQSTNAGCVDPS